MTLEQLRDEIAKYIVVVHDIEHILDSDIEFIATMTYEKNYQQLLYDYGIDILLIVLEVLEVNEDYLECRDILNTITFTNEIEGTDYPTKLVRKQ